MIFFVNLYTYINQLVNVKANIETVIDF